MAESSIADNIPKECRECRNWLKRSAEYRQKIYGTMISVVDKIQEKVSEEKYKPSLGDFLKVLEVQKELESINQERKEIVVRWVDQPTASNG